MAQDVKILTWNIEQYGGKKASFADIVEAIAKVVVDINPDIFILLEIKTTINLTAKAVVKTLADALYNLSGGNYRVAVISANTGLEFYGFFIKNNANTVPLVPVKKVGGGSVSIIGDENLAYSDVEFRKKDPVGAGVEVLETFPLISPDLDEYEDDEMEIGVPEWPGVRLPALATFWCTNATGARRLLPIAACHFAAAHGTALRQVKTLRYFSPFQGLGPPDPNQNIPTNPLSLTVNLLNGVTFNATLQHYVLTGDFNLNYISPNEQNLYNYIIGTTFPQLGARLYITEGTHLVTYANYNREMKYTLQLAVNDYDNLMLRNNPNTMAPTDAGLAGVRDIPNLIMYRHLKLNESVFYYSELDEKGFYGGIYNEYAVNYALQLSPGGDFVQSPINIQGALVGARLISDHLPVYFTVRLQ